METGNRSPLRLLAPASLVVFGLLFVIVIASSGGGGGGGEGASAAEKARDLGPTSTTPARRSHGRASKARGTLPRNVYVVKRGDTLQDIADKTGVPVERLKELNPGLDQFSLVAGQRIKLR
jgi:LysM repeat protein